MEEYMKTSNNITPSNITPSNITPSSTNMLYGSSNLPYNIPDNAYVPKEVPCNMPNNTVVVYRNPRCGSCTTIVLFVFAIFFALGGVGSFNDSADVYNDDNARLGTSISCWVVSGIFTVAAILIAARSRYRNESVHLVSPTGVQSVY